MEKEKFDAYVVVQKSGLTNMFLVSRVIELAMQLVKIKLTKDDCLDIMKNYSEYQKQFTN